MSNLKITIIGAGSTYTPELIEGVIERSANLPVTEIALMDIDQRKLDIVGGLCKRMIENAGLKTEVKLTMDLNEALERADFVLSQIRVGKLACRILDEKIPLKYGFIGQETTGIGGFFKALRTIPALLNITKQMEMICPDAWLINFSNPSGILAQALQNYTKIKTIGLCNVPINMIAGVEKALGETNLDIEYVGLNHLSYITGVKKEGKDLLSDALLQGVNGQGMKNIPLQGFSSELIQTIGAIPSSYLEYFYYRDDKLKHLMEEEKCRGEVCMDIEERLLTLYKDENLSVKPKELENRGGARYSEAAISLVDAIYNDKQEVHVVNTLNQGALEFMAEDDSVEISAVIGKNGVTPIPIRGFKNKHIMELMQTVKAYERHTVEAAIHGDEAEAMQALLIHPLVGDYNKARACFNEMKEAHKIYLPQFKN
ncbi:6-phospho-beta-glucosidase [Anaerocolumna sedimenticola]|uniref:6-phospho-beta-glucosidase n=1 Tax=Anaerocolumna sedimenticola TaxID=2696063 RepID=A0A6P1TF14_9FIRM|nr:6-phospho-beta-glucosidase [Anaerocolumna sedimenticola]QHQ59744.1 6-phospho-beta-glucosidase [Anaerocolumna sedimenticola]